MATALQSSQPPQLCSRRVFFENPLTFMVSLSREDWRNVRFERLIDPLDWPGEPKLVFEDPLGDDLADIQRNLYFALQDYWRMPGSATIKVQKYLESRVRRCHIKLVNLAIGYTWPGNPPGWIEFADA